MSTAPLIIRAPHLTRADRLPYLDTLRSLSIIAVVLLHVAAWDWYRMPVASSNWQVLNAYDSLVRFCVPVFFMVSGALFLQPARNITIHAIFQKYLPRIIIAFVVWSALYAALGTYGPSGDGSLHTLATQFMLGHYHLWFLFALAGLYLVTPLLRQLVADRKIAWYFVILALVFASLLPFFTKFPIGGQTLAQIIETMRLDMVLGYSLFFVLGYLLSTMSLPRRRVRRIALLGLAGVVATFGLTSLLSLWRGEASGLFYDFLAPNVIATAVAVFVLVRAFNTRNSLTRIPPHPLIALVGKLSFGIYLVHPFFQWAYQQVGITAASAPTIISVPLLTLLIIVPSALVASLLQRIPKVGSYIS